MNKIITVILSFFFSAQCMAQSITVQQYIDKYKDIAIAEMKRSGIPASITLAQGLLESEIGNSWLTARSNNHFGIKCKSNWTGPSVSHTDDAVGECFRKYNTAEESYRDHTDFLKNGARYSFLFSLNPSDYKGWAYGLKKAGYATNPRYPQILINSIERYELHKYTLQGISELENEPSMNKAPEDLAVLPVINKNIGASVISSDKTTHEGVKAVRALKGISLLAIASEHDIPLHRLMEYNDLEAEGLLGKDQWIFLEQKNKQGIVAEYKTSGQETVYDIAQANAVQLFYILEYNDFSENQVLEPGTVVKLQPSSQAVSKGEVVHNVQAKEGLYAISKKYKVSIDELKSMNNLTSNDLRVGQRLIISK